MLKRILFIILLIHSVLLGYDHFNGGEIALNLIHHAKNVDMETVQLYLSELKTPNKLAQNVYTQFKTINSIDGLVELLRQKTALHHHQKSNVMTLTMDNFDTLVNGSRPALVQFCLDCEQQQFALVELADSLAHIKDQIIIGQVNSKEYPDLDAMFDVEEYPALKWFPEGFESRADVEDYASGNDLVSLAVFIKEKTKLVPRVRIQKSNVIELDDDNFKENVIDSNKNVLVKFYAPWCGHCQNLAPIYEKIGDAFSNVDNCLIVKVNAEEADDVATDYDIFGYPTFMFFPSNKEEEPFVYEGERTEFAFIEFLNKRCGTQRTVGGGLAPTVGRIEALDALAIAFITQPSARETLHQQALTLAQEYKTRYALYYAKLMEKVLEKGDSFLKTEKARIEKIISSEDIIPAKLDDFNMRKNILAVFNTPATQ
ncbi:thioredoxin-domain-containing protein [Backusella circina FSU 941]|nr:thioredoxin-domain-containing protein [Backusella circina FSU 941]